MKKKHGFTLAEVLITLGIIGVVAALTAPALIQNASNAKVGPTLAKVVSTIENANQKMMLDEGVSRLSSVITQDYTNESSMQAAMLTYCEFLSTYIAGSSYQTTAAKSSDFVSAYKTYSGDTGKSRVGSIIFHFSNNIDILFEASTNTDVSLSKLAGTQKGSFRGRLTSMVIDINGIKTAPNTIGKDAFILTLDNSGLILPDGGKTYAWFFGNDSTWADSSSDFACNEDKVASGWGCAGSIFDNNLKVIYQ